MKKKSFILAAVPAIALFPFILLSFFNQPVGDDFWNTWMVKKYGFADAQLQLFTTVHGRFSASLFMSLNTFVHGSVLSFKFWPAAFVIGWVGVIYAIVRTFFCHSITRLQSLSMSLLLVLVYYANVPGLHEGGYWMSGLTCYQLPVLLYLFYLPMASGYSSQPSWKKYFFFPAYLFVAGGFHEMLAFMVMVTGMYIIIVKWQLSKKLSVQYIIFTAASALAFLIQLSSRGNRYKAGLTSARQQLGLQQVVWKAVSQTGYHILVHCLLSPLFWFAAITIFYVTNKAGWYIREISLPLKKSLLILGGIFSILFFFPGLFVINIEDNIAPLRVMNVSYIVFVVGFYTATALYASSLTEHKLFSGFCALSTGRQIVAGLLVLALSLAFATNMRQVLTTVISGDAYRYNQEVTERFRMIANCKEDSCAFTCLQHQPPVLCPVDICQNPKLVQHLEKVYNKKLIMYDVKPASRKP